MLITCSECGEKYSDQAISCPHCGAMISRNKYAHSYTTKNHVHENNKGLATAGLILAIISLFAFPGLGILSIIFGAIAVSTNEKNESWTKAVWQYENKALGFGRYSIMIGILDIVWMVTRINF